VTAAEPKKRWNWAGLIGNGIAFLIGSAFLLWACGFLFAMAVEGDSPGTLSQGDIVAIIVFSLLGIGSIAWLVIGAVRWFKRRKEEAT
jgi:hypothetical protein